MRRSGAAILPKVAVISDIASGLFLFYDGNVQNAGSSRRACPLQGAELLRDSLAMHEHLISSLREERSRRSNPPPNFVMRSRCACYCDEMLARLGRWLRAAGYDTAIAESGLADAGIIAQCAAEERTLLTRDRHLAAAAEDRIRVLRLADSSLAAQARALRAALAIDWQRAPFTRCLVDNTPLAAGAARHGVAGAARSRAAGVPLHLCPECRRLYWPGGHVRRMLARLAEWNQP